MIDRPAPFHLGDLLSVTDGRLLSPDHMDGVYRLVDHVTGQKHMTHQLPRAAEVVKPWLIEQHPWLDGLGPAAGSDAGDLIAWLTWAVTEYGEFHDVEPMPFGMYVGREPIAEAEEMVGPGRVFRMSGTPPTTSDRVHLDLAPMAREMAKMAEAFRCVGPVLRMSWVGTPRQRSDGPGPLAIDGHAYRRRIRRR
jgi:hypothetical protein